MKMYPKGSRAWDQNPNINLSPTEIIKMYESGYSGVYFDPDEYQKFKAAAIQTGGYEFVEDAAHAYGWADSSAGQLVVPFVHVLEAYPGCWPGPAQVVGDCVSHSNKNAILGTMVCQVVSGARNPITGFVERFPEVSQTGISHGVLATEPVYWMRGHSGHGWQCSQSARYSISTTGAVIRQDYPNINVDLTKYSGSNTTRWGRTPPPQNVLQTIGENKITTAARATTFEAIRDSLAQGRFVHTCGSEGFAQPRDKNGVSVRRGSWAHALCYPAVDDREEIKRMYNGPLVLVLNSWGRYNSGPRDIFDSAKYVPAAKKDLWTRLGIVSSTTGNIMIPEGSFWARWSDVSRREAYIFGGLNGWRIQKLNTLGGELWG